MKHRILSLLASSLLILGLAACDSAPAEETVDTTTVTEETTAAPDPDVVLVADGATQYSIVRSEDGSKAATECAVTLRKYMEACGLKPKITTDWEKNPVSDYEVIVGNTTRCADAGINIHDLGEEGYHSVHIADNGKGKNFIFGDGYLAVTVDNWESFGF